MSQSSNTRELPFFFTHIFPWPVVWAGIMVTWRALRKLRESISSYRWPTVDGRVVDSGLDYHSSSEDGPDICFPKIEYTYSVADEVHQGTRIAFADLNHTGETATNAFLKTHPAGKSIRVYYDPKMPASALLEPGVRVMVITHLIFGCLILAAGVAMVFIFGAWRW